MRVFDVPVSWAMAKTLKVGAISKEQAVKIANELWDKSPSDRLGENFDDADWVCDSFEVHPECIEEDESYRK